MTTLNQFDPDDYVEACAVPGCPARYGLGDHDHGRCYLCGRLDDETSVLVNIEDAVRAVCDSCWSKRDEGVDIGLDYTEDEPDFNVEGQPEFNGAFR